ncbi:disease resistance protein RPV1-like [Ziziphus jujuba]|uniref:Disease resistance protein RPV1-like n=1 Tax=Ziziphus jujuba TaxID=326968 RepID=A0ABM4AAS7_ZIZJJ|nr:disease resistance protein RPV1-like [Ziziphus jujuba]
MELLKDETILSLDTPFVLSTFIQNKLHRKKVLIVLDDLDSPVDLEALVEGYYHLAPGSRIIVTTRNLQVLRKGANRIYKVEGLNHHESLEHFHLHAFRKISLAPDYRVLSEKFSLYANGNPLALKVLGSFLCSRSKEEWQSALNKLKIVPKQDIHNMLRISYEGLDDTEKDIFLDIACFFNGYNRDYVESILDNGDSISKIAISVLIDKSLITENWNSWKDETELWMHDLLQQMGHAIVRGENKEPGKRSRLWIAKVVCQTFERNTGTGAIEGILFNMSEMKGDVELNRAAFSKIYFQWDSYPLRSLPSNFIPENLVELILSESQLEELWHGAQLLTQMPNLSQALNLEIISLEGCTILVHVPSYFQNLPKLQFLDLRYCSNLTDVEGISGRIDFLDHNTWKLKSIETLNVSPKSSGFNMNLRVLLLDGIAVEELLSSLGFLSCLTELSLDNCQRLESLPASIRKLKSSESLNVVGYPNLEKFPEILEPMERLAFLWLASSGIKELPESIENLTGLNTCNNVIAHHASSRVFTCARPHSNAGDIKHLDQIGALYNVTEASFQVRLSLYDYGDSESVDLKSDECCGIKKCGIWLPYDQEGAEKLNVAEEQKVEQVLGNKIEKRIYEYREDSGSDDISNGKGFNSKKIKLIP